MSPPCHRCGKPAEGHWWWFYRGFLYHYCDACAAMLPKAEEGKGAVRAFRRRARASRDSPPAEV